MSDINRIIARWMGPSAEGYDARYDECLDDCAEAEKRLTIAQRIKYVRELKFAWTGRHDRAVPDWWLVHEATAPQRASALAAVISQTKLHASS